MQAQTCSGILNPRNIYLDDSSGILNVKPELRIRALGSIPLSFQVCDMQQVSEPLPLFHYEHR